MSPRTQSSPKLHPSQLRSLRSRLRLSIRDASLTDLSPSARETGPFWDLDPQPLVISSEEWSLLSAAVTQRARLVNALLRDLYSEQRVLHEKILPPELVLADPYFRRPCLNVDPGRTNPANLLRFDLVKDDAGWRFTQTRANTPIGLSYAVQNRRFMTQEAGDLYRALPDYHSVINFPLVLLDALRALSPRQDTAPSIVVLTAGPRDPFFSEHSFLARKMGLPLARGDDLLVIDNCVYFKTVAGLERVDVIYRRLNDAYIDPVVFSTDRETAGIPGLLQCIRTGNVALTNAIGAGVAESRALEPYLPQLLRYYFSEKPLLPSLPTYTLGDHDQLEHTLDHLGSLRIRPAHDPLPWQTPVRGLHTNLVTARGLAPAVRQNPHAFVAQPLPGKGAFTLSSFVLCLGRRFDVFPGGLIHLGDEGPDRDRVGHTADVLVQLDAHSTGSIADLESADTGVRVHTLGSRAAEHLCWLGRYLERAENTARMLSILEDVAMEEVPARDRRRWLPVWRGLLEATGHAAEKLNARTAPVTTLGPDLTWRMTLDATNPSSIFSSVSWAYENARQLRDHVSPEAWSVLVRLRGRLDPLRHGSDRASAAGDALAAVLTETNAFFSTAERTMLHDAGWQFLRIGACLERASMTCAALRPILGAHDESLHRHLAPVDENAYRDNPELSALLRMLGSQDAYRRLYQTRSQPRQVAELFLQELYAPRSIFHLLHQIKNSLKAIHHDLGETEPNAPVSQVEKDLHFLASLRLSDYFTPEPVTPTIGDHLGELRGRLDALHPLLSDHYFSHQARLGLTADQIELPL
ncbi:MAG: circularly permuted type 2 ATP-grasp protein [Verrucomicrobiota bacterium]